MAKLGKFMGRNVVLKETLVARLWLPDGKSALHAEVTDGPNGPRIGKVVREERDGGVVGAAGDYWLATIELDEGVRVSGVPYIGAPSPPSAKDTEVVDLDETARRQLPPNLSWDMVQTDAAATVTMGALDPGQVMRLWRSGPTVIHTAGGQVVELGAKDVVSIATIQREGVHRPGTTFLGQTATDKRGTTGKVIREEQIDDVTVRLTIELVGKDIGDPPRLDAGIASTAVDEEAVREVKDKISAYWRNAFEKPVKDTAVVTLEEAIEAKNRIPRLIVAHEHVQLENAISLAKSEYGDVAQEPARALAAALRIVPRLMMFREDAYERWTHEHAIAEEATYKLAAWTPVMRLARAFADEQTPVTTAALVDAVNRLDGEVPAGDDPAAELSDLRARLAALGIEWRSSKHLAIAIGLVIDAVRAFDANSAEYGGFSHEQAAKVVGTARAAFEVAPPPSHPRGPTILSKHVGLRVCCPTSGAAGVLRSITGDFPWQSIAVDIDVAPPPVRVGRWAGHAGGWWVEGEQPMGIVPTHVERVVAHDRIGHGRLIDVNDYGGIMVDVYKPAPGHVGGIHRVDQVGWRLA